MPSDTGPHLAAEGSPLADLDTRPLAELAPRIRFWKGMELGVQGEPCDSLGILAEGHLLLSRRNPQGDEHALYLLGPGDLYGEGSLRPEGRWLVTARAVTDGAAHLLPAQHLPRLAQYYPQLAARVVALLSCRLERAHQRVDLLTTHNARERLLGLLEVMADYHGSRRGGERWIPVPLTQAELGEMVGLARETVARVLAELEAEGQIRRQPREGIWLRVT